MLSKEGIADLKNRLTTIPNATAAFFEEARQCDRPVLTSSNIWDDLMAELRQQGEELRTDIKALMLDIAGAARGSPLIDEADFQDLRHNTRRMLASVHFHRYAIGAFTPQQHKFC